MTAQAADAPDDSGSLGVPTIQAGQRIGDLQLLHEIGRGAQGIVFEGKQLSVNRTVAVKVVAKDNTFGDEQIEQIERFHREAEAAGRLSHPTSSRCMAWSRPITICCCCRSWSAAAA